MEQLRLDSEAQTAETLADLEKLKVRREFCRTKHAMQTYATPPVAPTLLAGSRGRVATSTDCQTFGGQIAVVICLSCAAAPNAVDPVQAMAFTTAVDLSTSGRAYKVSVPCNLAAYATPLLRQHRCRPTSAMHWTNTRKGSCRPTTSSLPCET